MKVNFVKNNLNFDCDRKEDCLKLFAQVEDSLILIPGENILERSDAFDKAEKQDNVKAIEKKMEKCYRDIWNQIYVIVTFVFMAP